MASSDRGERGNVLGEYQINSHKARSVFQRLGRPLPSSISTGIAPDAAIDWYYVMSSVLLAAILPLLLLLLQRSLIQGIALYEDK